MSEENFEAELSTHDAVAKRLKQLNHKGEVDISTLLPYEHEVAGATLYAGPMAYEDHKKWQDIKRFEELQHNNANKTEWDPMDKIRSDTHLLAHAVYTAEGKILGKELATLLIKTPGAGPHNYTLLSEAEKANPPRELLATEVVQMMNARSVDCILWRLLIEGGLVKVLIDHMSSHSTPEEKEWAKTELIKAEEVAMSFWGIFQAEDISKSLGITYKSSFKLLADTGADAEEIVQSMRAAESEDIEGMFQQPPE